MTKAKIENEDVLTKSRILDYKDEAQALVEQYERANKESKNGVYNYGTMDKVILKLWEKDENFITIGMNQNAGTIRVYGVFGHVTEDGIVYVDPSHKTVTKDLGDIKGTTVARFTESLCDVIYERINEGPEDLKRIMINSCASYLTKIKHQAEKYSA